MSTANQPLLDRPPTLWMMIGLVVCALVFGALVSLMPTLAIGLVLMLIGLVAFAACVRFPQLFLYLFAFMLPYQAEFSSSAFLGATLNPQNILNTMLIALVLCRLLPNWHVPAVPAWRRWGLFVLISAAAIATGPLVTSLAQGTWVVYRVALIAPLSYLAVIFYLRTPEQAKRMLAILAFSASLAALTAVAQTATGGNVLGGLITNQRYLGLFQRLPPIVTENFDRSGTHLLYLSGTNIYRGHGTFYTNNVFGAFLGITVCLTWGLLRGAHGWHRWVWFAALAAQIAGIIATFSRSSIATMLLGLIVMVGAEIVLFGGRRAIMRALRLIPIVALTLVLALVIALQFETILRHLTTLLNFEKVTEFQWRLLVWQYTIQQIPQRPWLGFGTGILQNVSSYLVDQDFGPHNILLDVAYRSGIIVLGLFIVFLWQWLRSAWRWGKRATVRSERMLAIGVFAAGIVFLVAGMASSLTGMDNMTSLFWTLAGVATAMWQSTERRQRKMV